MAQAMIHMLRTGYEAFNRGDWDTVLGMAHPELELVTADRITSPGTYRGPAEIRTFFEDLFAPFEEVVSEPEKCRSSRTARKRSRPRVATATAPEAGIAGSRLW